MIKNHEYSDILYRMIVENAEEGIWLIDENSQTTFVNEKMASILGYTSEEMLGKDMFYFMTEEHIKTAQDNMARRKTGVKEHHDFIFQSKQGNKVWTTIAASPILDKNGKFIGALGMVNNISARRRSEKLLEAQRKIFELLVKGATLESALAELTTAIEYLMDDVLVSVLLLDEEGLRLWKGAAPSLPDAYSVAINGALIGPKEGSCGTSAYSKKLVIVSDIQVDPLWENYKNLAAIHNLRSCWSSPIFSSDHIVLGTFAVYSKSIRIPNEFELQLIQDATAASALCIQHTRALQNLKISRDDATFLSEARKTLVATLDYEQVLKKIPQMIVSHFADWCFICQIDKHGKLHSIAEDALASKSQLIKQLQNYSPNMDATEGLPRAIREKKSILYTEVNEQQLKFKEPNWPIIGTKDPKILTIFEQLGLKSYMAIPMVIRGKVVGGFLVASSRLEKRYNQYDLDLATELAHSCGMAIDNAELYRDSQQAITTREVFISVASHEFRTPLTILRGKLDLLNIVLDKNQIETQLKEKLKGTLEGLTTQTDRISKLVETLLDISKIGTGTLFLNQKKLNLSALVTDLLDRMKTEFASKQNSLVINIQEDVYCSCDVVRIEQVLTNLLSNALKFGQQQPVEFSLMKESGRAIIEVKDHGLGISKEDQLRIFEAFERAVSEKHYSGLGLGLYITKQIISAHGGSITLESQLGKGACFRVYLPLIK